jgi:hypothetical protein
MSTERTDRARREGGQVLVLFTLALVAMLAAVALVIDGGNAWAQERQTQNGTDAAAFAGATVLADDIVNGDRTDADVLTAVNGAATEMAFTVGAATYTDIAGNDLGIAVGQVPGNEIPPGALGVAVTGERQFDTFIAGLIGMSDFTAVTEATAVSGELDAPGIGLLPVTPPINILTCDGQNRPDFLEPATEWAPETLYRIPLCASGAGNVGWLDWTPPSGGSSELASCISDPENTPGCTTPITVPSWQYVTATGNTNSGPVESALRGYDGEIVLFPLFDDTCNEQPVDPDPNDGVPAEECLGGNGNGQNFWYHFVGVGAFQLCATGITDDAGNPCTEHGSYLQGSNSDECEVGGNGATSCLVGQFVETIYRDTTVDPLNPPGSLGYPSPTTFVGTQLVK